MDTEHELHEPGTAIDEPPIYSWWDRWQMRREFKRLDKAERRLKRARERGIKKTKRKSMELDVHARGTLFDLMAARHNGLVAGASAEAILKERMADRNRRFRYVALIGSWLLIAAIALFTMCSCAHVPKATWIEIDVPTAPDTETESITRLVQVRTWCITETTTAIGVAMQSGSGVAVSDTEILTALHVITCEVGLPFVQVTTYQGRTFVVNVMGRYKPYDIARLRMPPDSELGIGVKPVRYGGKPAAGAVVCSRVAIPKLGFHCGFINELTPGEPAGDASGDITGTFFAEHGNSGAALYNTDGELVGIVTAMRNCTRDDAGDCGGYASSLAHRRIIQ